METVGATRRFFACGYEGGASGQIPSIKDHTVRNQTNKPKTWIFHHMRRCT